MRSLVLLIAGLGLGAAPLLAQPETTASAPEGPAHPDSLFHYFEAANEAYTNGWYEPAVTRYRQILDAGYTSGALYHNLGNAYVRLDRTGPAVWAYEKGLRLRPDDPRLHHNLEYVRLRAGLPTEGLPARGMVALVEAVSPVLVFGFGWLLLSAGVIGAVFWTERDRLLAWHHPGVWAPTVVGLLMIIGAMGSSYVQAQDERAVVVAEEVGLRTSLDAVATQDTTVAGGGMVEVQARRDSLTRVRLGDGTVGWVPETALRGL